jgi:hypothetical protein
VPIVGGRKSINPKRFIVAANGRAFRIAQDKDKRWTLYRVEEIDDKGELPRETSLTSSMVG